MLPLIAISYILTTKDINKYLYRTLIQNNETPSCRPKWNTLYLNEEIDWKMVHSSVFNCTKDTYT